MTALFGEVGFAVDATDDLAALTEGNLAQYVGVVNYTTARAISDEQYAALLGFARGGPRPSSIRAWTTPVGCRPG